MVSGIQLLIQGGQVYEHETDACDHKGEVATTMPLSRGGNIQERSGDVGLCHAPISRSGLGRAGNVQSRSCSTIWVMHSTSSSPLREIPVNSWRD